MPVGGHQSLGSRFREMEGLFRKCRLWKLGAELVGDGDGNIGNAAGMQGQSMVCFGAGKRKRAFGGVHPRECLRIGWIARARPVVREPNLIGAGAQRIGIKGQDDAGVTKTWPWVQRSAKSDLCSIAFVFFPDRFIGVPCRFGVFRQKLIDLPKQCRRGNSAGQQP